MRTDLLSSVDAQAVASAPDAPRSPDLPPDMLRRLDLGPERPTDLSPPDRPTDLAVEVPVDLKAPLPDLPPLRDVMPDSPRDLPPDLPRDLPPDRARERFFDLPADLPPETDGSCSLGSTVPCGCDNGMLGSKICLPSLVYSECGCGTEALMRVKNGLIGTWTGTVTTPWLPPYHVTFTFDSYNHYSAKALDGNGSPALYYGTDNDSPLKRYDITDIQANGDATGTIDVCFEVSDCGRNKLQAIQLSADLSRLKFYFNYVEQYGPLQYDLQRTVP